MNTKETLYTLGLIPTYIYYSNTTKGIRPYEDRNIHFKVVKISEGLAE